MSSWNGLFERIAALCNKTAPLKFDNLKTDICGSFSAQGSFKKYLQLPKVHYLWLERRSREVQIITRNAGRCRANRAGACGFP